MLRQKARSQESFAQPGHGVAELLAPAFLAAEDMQAQRNALRAELQEGATFLRANLACFADHLAAEPNENARRDLLEESCAQMAEFRQLQVAAADDLRAEEEVLTRELAIFAERMASPEWEARAATPAAASAPVAAPPPPPTRSRQPVHCDAHHPLPGARAYGPSAVVAPGEQPPEVLAVEEFEAEHGRFGGWDEPDQRRFKKALTRAGEDHRRVLPFAEEALPEFSTAAIKAHIQWDFEHEELITRRRAAIQLWRAQREAQRHVAAAAEAAAATPDAARAERLAASAEAKRERLRRAEERAALAAWREKKSGAAAAQQAAADAAEALRLARR